MPKYVVDTNVYIDASRDATEAERLKLFLARWLPVTYMSAVVIQELRAGARTGEQTEALERWTLAPFARRGRILVPSAQAFEASGRILADLVGKDGVELASARASLPNDTLLAASCREAGATLVTRDGDFERIATHLRGFRHVAPWPVSR